MSSDERIKVAKRLREYSNDSLKDGSLLKTLKDVTGAGSWRYVLDALADMIDPTCEVVVDEPDGGAGEFVAQMNGTVCSRCGGDMPRDRFTGAYPDYCPRCGARVVGSEGSVTR